MFETSLPDSIYLPLHQESRDQNDVQPFGSTYTEVGGEFEIVDGPDSNETLSTEELKIKCQVYESEIQSLKTKVGGLEEEKQLWKDRDTHFDTNDGDSGMTTLNQELQEKNERIASKNKKLEKEIKQIRADHEKEIEEKEINIENLEKDLKDQKKKYKAKMNEIEEDSDRSSESSEWRRKCLEANKKAKDYKEENDDIKEELKDIEEECCRTKENSQKTIQNLEKQLKAEHSKIKGVLADELDRNGSFQRTIQDLENQLKEKGKVISILRVKMKENVEGAEFEKTIAVLQNDCVLKNKTIDKISVEKEQALQINRSLEEKLRLLNLEVQKLMEDIINQNAAGNGVLKHPDWWIKHMD